MFKKSLSEEEIKSLIDQSLEEKIKSQKEEIEELRRMVKNQSGEIYKLRKQVSEQPAGESYTLNLEDIEALSKKISQEILSEPEEETMKRAKPFCNENGEMTNSLSRMGYILSECTNFTKNYVSKMLTSLFVKK
ncbi:MAG: hypothetical protein PUB89_10365 [Oscillospiraceae bacterium]|nr:hypothetical protein [Oscillospiraceae bacterium]MDD6083223.1 hypothetical protein [Oscillospiraceae bacterium]